MKQLHLHGKFLLQVLINSPTSRRQDKDGVVICAQQHFHITTFRKLVPTGKQTKVHDGTQAVALKVRRNSMLCLASITNAPAAR